MAIIPIKDDSGLWTLDSGVDCWTHRPMRDPRADPPLPTASAHCSRCAGFGRTPAEGSLCPPVAPMAWNRYGPPTAASTTNSSQMVSGAPSLSGMNQTYRPGAFFNYMGLPHGTTRTYMTPGDASPAKKLQQLKDLLDEDLIDQSDFDAQKAAILSSLVKNGGERPRIRAASTTQDAYGPPSPAKQPTLSYSQFAYQPPPAPAPAPAPASTAYAPPDRMGPGGADDALENFMEASPVKKKAAERSWQPAAAAQGGPHGVSIDVPVGSSDDALDGFISAADMSNSPFKPSFGGGSPAADGDRRASNTAAAVRLQGEFGAAGPQDLPPRAGSDPRASISVPDWARGPTPDTLGAGGRVSADPRVGGGFAGGAPH